MGIEFLERCDVIEECYEFLLGYAAQGLPSDEGSPAGREVRSRLQQAREALDGLAESCRRAISNLQAESVGTYETFFATLERDAADSAAVFDLVLAQPALGSQLIDNLNASSHVRALLTDLFLVGEVLRSRERVAPAG